MQIHTQELLTHRRNVGEYAQLKLTFNCGTKKGLRKVECAILDSHLLSETNLAHNTGVGGTFHKLVIIWLSQSLSPQSTNPE